MIDYENIHLDGYGTKFPISESAEVFRKFDMDSDEAGHQHTLIRRLAMNTLIPFTRGVGIDLGSQKCPVSITAIRIDHDSRFKHLQHIDIDFRQFRNLDYITTSHVLEDFARPLDVLSDMLSCLKVGGFIANIMPHCDIYPKPGEPNCNPAHRYPTWPSTAVEWERAMQDRLRLVQLDECKGLRERYPGCFDFDAVYIKL